MSTYTQKIVTTLRRGTIFIEGAWIASGLPRVERVVIHGLGGDRSDQRKEDDKKRVHGCRRFERDVVVELG